MVTVAKKPRASPLDLSLVIPCYNEEAVLQNTVNRLADSFAATEVALEFILVDNGSSDKTGEIIDQLAESGHPVVKVVVAENEGYGNGVLAALPSCKGRFFGITCADGQVEASDVVKVYEIAAGAEHPSLVKVRRRFRMDGFTRRVISAIYNFGTLLMFGGLNSIDINGSPKIFPRDYLEPMNLISKDWFLDAEVMIKAKKLGLEVLEFNVLAQMREGGSSHVRMGTCWEFAGNLLKYRFGGMTLGPAPERSESERRSTPYGRTVSAD